MRKGVVTEWISTPHSDLTLRGRRSPDYLFSLSTNNNVYIIKNGKRIQKSTFLYDERKNHANSSHKS